MVIIMLDEIDYLIKRTPSIFVFCAYLFLIFGCIAYEIIKFYYNGGNNFSEISFNNIMLDIMISGLHFGVIGKIIFHDNKSAAKAAMILGFFPAALLSIPIFIMFSGHQ